MADNKKAVCGGFLVGDGLEFEGKTLKTTGTGGTEDYTELENKPSINSVELNGNKTLEDLGIASKDDLDTVVESVDDIVDDIETIDTTLQQHSDKIAANSSRIDTFTNLPEGSTTGDAELADIRVGYDGKTYNSAGSAVRDQVSGLKQDLGDLIVTDDDDITENTMLAVETDGGEIEIPTLEDLRNETARATERENEIEALFSMPTQAAVDDWLNRHPEATTTVQDRSLTLKKFKSGEIPFVTPEMFGAVGDGVTDDTSFFTDMLNSVPQTDPICIVLKGVYKVSAKFTITRPLVCVYGGEIIHTGNEFIHFYNCQSVMFCGVKISHDTLKTSGKTISFNRCDHVSISNAIFDNAYMAISFDYSSAIADGIYTESVIINGIDLINCVTGIHMGFVKNCEVCNLSSDQNSNTRQVFYIVAGVKQFSLHNFDIKSASRYAIHTNNYNDGVPTADMSNEGNWNGSFNIYNGSFYGESPFFQTQTSTHNVFITNVYAPNADAVVTNRNCNTDKVLVTGCSFKSPMDASSVGTAGLLKFMSCDLHSTLQDTRIEVPFPIVFDSCEWTFTGTTPHIYLQHCPLIIRNSKIVSSDTTTTKQIIQFKNVDVEVICNSFTIGKGNKLFYDSVSGSTSSIVAHNNEVYGTYSSFLSSDSTKKILYSNYFNYNIIS